MCIAACYEDIGTAPAVRHLRGLDDQVERDAQENYTAQGQRVDNRRQFVRMLVRN